MIENYTVQTRAQIRECVKNFPVGTMVMVPSEQVRDAMSIGKVIGYKFINIAGEIFFLLQVEMITFNYQDKITDLYDPTEVEYL